MEALKSSLKQDILEGWKKKGGNMLKGVAWVSCLGFFVPMFYPTNLNACLGGLLVGFSGLFFVCRAK